MKKLSSFIFCLFCICTFLSGCGTNDTESSSDNSEFISLDDSEITIPAGLVGTEVSDIDAASVDSSTGNITYSLSGKERSDIVNNISAEIDESIATILADKDYYPDITAITYNDDFTEFTVELSDGQANIYESMLSMSFYTIGNKYQIYSGIDADDALTTVTYINASTKEVVAQSDSSSMNTQ